MPHLLLESIPEKVTVRIGRGSPRNGCLLAALDLNRDSDAWRLAGCSVVKYRHLSAGFPAAFEPLAVVRLDSVHDRCGTKRHRVGGTAPAALVNLAP